MPMKTAIPSRLVRCPEVLDRTGYRKSWLYTLIRRGEFPEPVRLGARAVAWREADLQTWIESRPNRSDAA
jgi:prophage regulatory protein